VRVNVAAFVRAVDRAAYEAGTGDVLDSTPMLLWLQQNHRFSGFISKKIFGV
jgi:hypothetical protein